MRTLYLLILVALTTHCAFAQYYEVGLQAGASNYAGELTTNGFRPSEYHPAIGIYGRYNHSPRLAAKAAVMLGQISGSDQASGNANTLSRNLDFRSPIYELAAMGEFNLMPYAPRNNQGSALYVTAGVGAFYFNPQAQFNGDWIDLQPLGTEGQNIEGNGKPYSRVQLSIPFGGGAKINVTDRVNLGIEVLMRRTFTDHLDDISGSYPDLDVLNEQNPMAAALSFRTPQYFQAAQPNPVGKARGNADVDDYYMTVMLKIGFNLTHKQGMDFDPKYDIFKDPPPALSASDAWWLEPRA